jgi:hypothetical protein
MIGLVVDGVIVLKISFFTSPEGWLIFNQWIIIRLDVSLFVVFYSVSSNPQRFKA